MRRGARRLVTDQVSELARSKLKSGLDVSFAQVNLSTAKLLLVSAENQASAGYADLSAAIGLDHTETFTLQDPEMPGELPPGATELVRRAITQRPDMAVLRLQYESDRKFAQAEGDLSRPTISALVAAGGLPARAEENLRGRYLAAGVNVSIPVFNGHLFSARHQEAEYHAQSSAQRLRELQNAVARDVEVALLNANTAWQRVGLTGELLTQARQALDLAQSRYDLGLGSIVELSQAQLNVTSAEIQNSGARYDYQLQRSVLRYQTGTLR
ncbi:MAG: TolC family protein [Acidobacteria bacterium]|nr:TolC family protein [Acidobacteriota bacterium]